MLSEREVTPTQPCPIGIWQPADRSCEGVGSGRLAAHRREFLKLDGHGVAARAPSTGRSTVRRHRAMPRLRSGAWCGAAEVPLSARAMLPAIATLSGFCQRAVLRTETRSAPLKVSVYRSSDTNHSDTSASPPCWRSEQQR